MLPALNLPNLYENRYAFRADEKAALPTTIAYTLNSLHPKRKGLKGYPPLSMMEPLTPRVF